MSLEKQYSIHFETLGCRLNQDESEGAAYAFTQNGFCVSMTPLTSQSFERDEVVLAVINTCTVTAKAEQKARRIIRLMVQKFPNAVILVTGCYAQMEPLFLQSIDSRVLALPGSKKHLLSDIAKEMNGGALDVLSNKFSKDSLASFIAAKDEQKKSSVLSSSALGVNSGLKPKLSLEAFSLFTPVFQKHSRSLLKIQDGCNCACTFCRIHLARGSSVSLSVSEVVSRARALEENGMKEVVLTGVNISQYCAKSSSGNVNLASLIEEILCATKSIRIRLSSLYPQSIQADLCKSLSNARVQPFFHLSIQSGSNKILSKMARPHSVEQVYNAIDSLRKIKENPFISCDIITGFPGESEEDFSLTERLCQKEHFSWIHVFPFSAREGTPAKDFKDQVPESIKRERAKRLTELAVQGKIEYIKAWKEKPLFAITEDNTSGQKSSNKIYAVTENFLHVACDQPQGAPIPSGTAVTLCIDSPLEKSIREGGEVECSGKILSV